MVLKYIHFCLYSLELRILLMTWIEQLTNITRRKEQRVHPIIHSKVSSIWLTYRLKKPIVQYRITKHVPITGMHILQNPSIICMTQMSYIFSFLVYPRSVSFLIISTVSNSFFLFSILALMWWIMVCRITIMKG